MKYKAEIFDQLQYLYRTTGFNDHQLHCVIEFENKLNAKVMESAVKALVKIEPILSGTYRNLNGKSYWEVTGNCSEDKIFTIVRNEQDFKKFTFSRTEEEVGPQIKVCLYSSEKDSLSIVMNHMVTDGAGMKQCAYLLAELYSKILEDPKYRPKQAMQGDRSFKKILSGIPFRMRARILFLNNRENNRAGGCGFPMSTGDNTAPFILTHRVDHEKYIKIIEYCKRNQVTVNDFLLSVYFRVLSELLHMEGKTLHIPIMIDMRRYLKDKQNLSLTNLSSTVIISTRIDEGEDFKTTLHKVNLQISARKDNYLGLNPFLKLHAAYQLFGDRMGFQLLKKSLNNPDICMTNIGVIDEHLLNFRNSQVGDAYICGSIKFRPHFQMAASSFKESMTLSVNLYGDQEDQKNIMKFFEKIDLELNRVL